MKTNIDKLIMITVAVSDMPKAKEFYADKLGLKIVTDYRQDDENWWVNVAFPGGGTTITLAKTNKMKTKPSWLVLYFATPDIAAAHEELKGKGIKVNDIKDDLYGPGSGVKWFNFEDPDGNLIHYAQS
jgi:catechol 2,3-dioxygenase-like lactoylglutathione lyase family enzyme